MYPDFRIHIPIIFYRLIFYRKSVTELLPRLISWVYFLFFRCVNSIKHYALDINHFKQTYMFGMGQFDSLEELVEHFKCMPVLGSESGWSSFLLIILKMVEKRFCLSHTIYLCFSYNQERLLVRVSLRWKLNVQKLFHSIFHQ